MKYEYKYKGVDVAIATDRLDDDPKERVSGWDIIVDGRVLCCAIINNMTVLYLGDQWETMEALQLRATSDDSEGDTDICAIFAIDPGVLHATGRRFDVKPISTGRGRGINFDYRAVTMGEDVPLEAVHPYIDHMLAFRELYKAEDVERVMRGLVDDAQRNAKTFR